MTAPDEFHEALKAQGWSSLDGATFSKGDWRLVYDTSSWLMTFTAGDQRAFDVHVPGAYESRWTVNLIEHLCSVEDERRRLKSVLNTIIDHPEDAARLAHLALASERKGEGPRD